MSKKLAAKAGLIQVPPLPSAAAAAASPTPVPPTSSAPAPASDLRAKTAPGSMLQFLSTQSVAIREADELREKLRAFDGALPVRELDPALIRVSRWANRHEASFVGEEFEELQREIAAAGGNVQPIKVRPLPGAALNGSTPAYELVFGHRRHRACLELGLPVRALVEEASDQELFEAMERENRSRKNLSPWEQGSMYRRALEEGLYPSLRKLAEAVSVDVSLVSKSVALARLPEAVVAAFPSPLEIQFRWAQPLSELLQKDPEGMLRRAREIRESGLPLTAQHVFLILSGQDTPAGSTALKPVSAATATQIRRGGKRVATLSTDARGRAVLSFEAGVLSAKRQAALLKLVEDFLEG